MSDAGLKPVVVYHNLSPAELYEKASCKQSAQPSRWCRERAWQSRAFTLWSCNSRSAVQGQAAHHRSSICSANSPAAPALLQALQYEPSSHIVAGGALATISGAKTGRR